MGQQSLCKVSELALCGSIQDLIERTDKNSNVCSTEETLPKTVDYGGNGLRAALGVHRLRQFNCLNRSSERGKQTKLLLFLGVRRRSYPHPNAIYVPKINTEESFEVVAKIWRIFQTISSKKNSVVLAFR